MTRQMRVEVGGHPSLLQESVGGSVYLRSDPLIEPSVWIDVWHEDGGEFLQAYEQSGAVDDPVTVPAPDGNRCVARFSQHAGPIHVTHWDGVRYGTVDEFETAWRERVLDGVRS